MVAYLKVRADGGESGWLAAPLVPEGQNGKTAAHRGG